MPDDRPRASVMTEVLCTCEVHPESSSGTVDPECRRHGTEANRHPHWRDPRPQPGTVGTGTPPNISSSVLTGPAAPLRHADPCTCTRNLVTGQVVDYDCGDTLMHQANAALGGPPLEETSAALIDQLTQLADHYGAAGVARTAAQLAGMFSVVYSFVDGPDTPLSDPEITIKRGGVRFPANDVGETVDVRERVHQAWTDPNHPDTVGYTLPRITPVTETTASVGPFDVPDPTEGTKNDFADGKGQRYDLIALGPLEDLADLLGYGSQKYAARNWEQGFAWSRAYNALVRHLQAFWGGEIVDPESGAPHMVAVMCNAMFLAEFTETHPELDDRPGRHT